MIEDHETIVDQERESQREARLRMVPGADLREDRPSGAELAALAREIGLEDRRA